MLTIFLLVVPILSVSNAQQSSSDFDEQTRFLKIDKVQSAADLMPHVKRDFGLAIPQTEQRRVPDDCTTSTSNQCTGVIIQDDNACIQMGAKADVQISREGPKKAKVHGGLSVADDLALGGVLKLSTTAVCGADSENGIRLNAATMQLEICNGKKWLALGQGASDEIDLMKEKAQIYKCKSQVKTFANGERTHNFLSTECKSGSGVTGLGMYGKKCAIGLKAASQCGNDEDWRAYNSPPRMMWWMQSSCAGGRIEADYLCPAVGSTLSEEWEIITCYAWKKSTGSSHSHTFSASDCGGKTISNVEKCMASNHRRVQSGRDEDWHVQPGVNGLKVTWWCSSCSATVDIAVDYICPKVSKPNGWKLHQCNVVIAEPKQSGANFYSWKDNDCSVNGMAGKPAGTCFSGWRGATHPGADEDYVVNGPEDPEGPGVSWWITGGHGAATLRADYLCVPDSGPEPTKPSYSESEYSSQLFHCSYTPTSRGAGAKTRTFTASDCGGTLSFGTKKNCAVGIKGASQSGGDEDFRAFNNPPKMTWWMRGSAGSGGNIAADYLCPASGSDFDKNWKIYHCKSTVKKSGSSHSHTFTLSECGGEFPRPIHECHVASRERSQSGSDEDWGIGWSDPLTSTWWCSSCTASVNIAVDYICPRHGNTYQVSRWKGWRCKYSKTNNSGKSHSHKFSASECGGTLPTGKCFTTLRHGAQSGADEDWVAKRPGEAGGPGVTWWCSSCTATANIRVDFFCYN